MTSRPLDSRIEPAVVASVSRLLLYVVPASDPHVDGALRRSFDPDVTDDVAEAPRDTGAPMLNGQVSSSPGSNGLEAVVLVS